MDCTHLISTANNWVNVDLIADTAVCPVAPLDPAKFHHRDTNQGLLVCIKERPLTAVGYKWPPPLPEGHILNQPGVVNPKTPLTLLMEYVQKRGALKPEQICGHFKFDQCSFDGEFWTMRGTALGRRATGLGKTKAAAKNSICLQLLASFEVPLTS